MYIKATHAREPQAAAASYQLRRASRHAHGRLASAPGGLQDIYIHLSMSMSISSFSLYLYL